MSTLSPWQRENHTTPLDQARLVNWQLAMKLYKCTTCWCITREDNRCLWDIVRCHALSWYWFANSVSTFTTCTSSIGWNHSWFAQWTTIRFTENQHVVIYLHRLFRYWQVTLFTFRSVGIFWSSLLSLLVESFLSMDHSWAAPVGPNAKRSYRLNYA